MHFPKYFTRKLFPASFAQFFLQLRSYFTNTYGSFRCEKFIVFEKSEGIIQQLKQSPLRSLSTSLTSNSISHSSARQYSAETKWKSWIAQSLNTGRLWSGFLIHINSLIW